MIQNHTGWQSSFENLSHLHTLWAPYLENACIALKKEIPDDVLTAHYNNSFFKSVLYRDHLDTFSEATLDPAVLMDYINLWSPHLSGWVGYIVAGQQSMREALQMLSVLSPVLDSQCVNYFVESEDRFEVRLNHLLLPKESTAMSGTLQVLTTLDAVNSFYWIGTAPEDIEVMVPQLSGHNVARRCLQQKLLTNRWPVSVTRHNEDYYSVLIPKKNTEGGRLKLTAPYRNSRWEEGLPSTARDALFGNGLILDEACQRYLICNPRRQDLEGFCQWAGIPRATMNRRLKAHGLAWQDIKVESRFRLSLALQAHGKTRQQIADELGMTVKEHGRWMRQNHDTYFHLRGIKEAQGSAV